ncbi:MAG: secondary thiamine-phosphate synthase enzyme YjbQ [Pseudomonadales bacterium]|nr:secondary thiamine-phosphate synthase enzyme YjbQ [Pseudomonadales bacterium]
MNYRLTVSVAGQGLHDVTHKVREIVRQSAIRDGLVTVFVRHTSASLLIQENADPAVRADLERWLNRLVPEGDPLYTHTEEGPDDMPAHIKGALTATSLAIPLMDGALALGPWQGIYLWEHRHHRGVRELVVSVLADRDARSGR